MNSRSRSGRHLTAGRPLFGGRSSLHLNRLLRRASSFELFDCEERSPPEASTANGESVRLRMGRTPPRNGPFAPHRLRLQHRLSVE